MSGFLHDGTRRLVLVLDYRGALRQRQQEYESLDVARVTAALAAGGWAVRTCRFEEIANGDLEPVGELIHYTSTQDPRYRPFVDDVLFELSRRNELVPRYELFRAHENKVYQELLRRRLGLGGPRSRVYGNLGGLEAEPHLPEFPAVHKPAAGFQGSGVGLALDPQDLARRVRNTNRPDGLLLYRLKQWLKRNLLRGRYRPEQYEDCVHAGPFTVQEFIPGADGDWKVLVFGPRLFVLRRQVRRGDFRASGSGRFSHDTPPDRVLEFAAAVTARLDVPLVSLDIIDTPAGCGLVEFQALHFGTLTLDAAPHHFELEGGSWRRLDGPADLEDEYARALLHWLDARTAGRKDEAES